MKTLGEKNTKRNWLHNFEFTPWWVVVVVGGGTGENNVFALMCSHDEGREWKAGLSIQIQTREYNLSLGGLIC